MFNLLFGGEIIISVQVKLRDIIEEMELQFEESHSFLNNKTGEIVLISCEDLSAAEDEEPFEDLPEWEQENRLVANDVVENFDNYIELPTKYEVNEYEIMENFCLSVSDDRKQESLLRAIKGKGAFRRFKDKIIDLDMEEQWYLFRDDCFKQIAIQWCQEHKINFIE
ncbi:UPF0158 family protein [Bacillus sp. ISL-18]|uniref:UPF0158 family protein n=1 Tax=Bacillus sp. ISL-18 TaxID=2819118 RepID=UPI0020356F6E|nr:UPF0158 family protein [Bacillus sp. ISL-18]